MRKMLRVAPVSAFVNPPKTRQIRTVFRQEFVAQNFFAISVPSSRETKPTVSETGFSSLHSLWLLGCQPTEIRSEADPDVPTF